MLFGIAVDQNLEILCFVFGDVCSCAVAASWEEALLTLPLDSEYFLCKFLYLHLFCALSVACVCVVDGRRIVEL